MKFAFIQPGELSWSLETACSRFTRIASLREVYQKE